MYQFWIVTKNNHWCTSSDITGNVKNLRYLNITTTPCNTNLTLLKDQVHLCEASIYAP